MDEVEPAGLGLLLFEVAEDGLGKPALLLLLL